MSVDTRTVVATCAVVAISLGILYLAYTTQSWRPRPSDEGTDDEFGDLGDLVSFSSKKIAACRAIETEQADALFRDPLARLLAGPQAMQQARQSRSTAAEPPGDATPEPRQLNNIVLRTRYIDDLVRFFTGAQSAPPLSPALTQRLGAPTGGAAPGTARQGGPPGIRQVVLLGAGMDTRAWRLELPAGVAWLEVDQAHVLAAKLAVLRAQGVQTSSAEAPGKGTCHSLRCASYAAVGVDFTQESFRDALRGTAFDAALPTLWVAEGLTYYLSRNDNAALFRAMAAASAPGSVWVASMVSEAKWRRIAAKPGAGIMSTWQWGYPPNFEQVAREWGWRLVEALAYDTVAAAYGYKYARRGAPAKTPEQSDGADQARALMDGDDVVLVVGQLRQDAAP